MLGGSGGGITTINNATGPAITIAPGTNIGITTVGNTITINDTGPTGTVTSVALADGSSTPIYTISGSPVTSSGTLTFTLNTEAANVVFAGPTSGGAAQPTFRGLVAADLPAGTGTVTSVSVVTANGLAGTVATATTTPAITLSTTVTGILQGNGTAISAATTGNLTDAGTDGIVVTGGTGAVLGSGTSIAQHVADTTHNGYLSSVDWNTFNNKQSALTLGNLTDVGTDGITITGGTGAVVGTGTSISQHVADTTHNGYLSSTDWNTFNSSSGAAITSLTGDATATGPGAAALTLATVNGNVGSFGSSTSIPSFTVNAKGLITAASGNVVIAPAGTLSGTTLNSTVVTSSLTSLGTQSVALNMGSHQINAVTDPTAAQDAATKNYVDTVASGLQPIQAVAAATTGSNISGTYSNGVAGVGATFTTTSTSTFTVDGYTPGLTERILIKDQTSGFQNGVYNVTQLATGILPTIFTRALDYDTAGDMNAGSLVPVIHGTVNALTSWLQTATITTVGTDSLVFTEWTANPANYLLKANNLSDVSSPSTSFNNISPMTTGGDIIYGGTSGAGTRLPNGTSGQVLTSNGGTSAPSWQTPSGSSGFQFFASSQVTTDSTALTTNTYTTFSNSPGFSVPVTVTGTYKVYCSAPFQCSASQFQVKIINSAGGATLLYESRCGNATSGGVAADASLFLQSVFTLTSGNTYTFDIQAAVSSGQTVLQGSTIAQFYMFAELCG